MRRRLPLVVLALFCLLAALLNPTSAGAVASAPTPSCVGSACTLTYSYNADFYTWTVPAGTTSFTFTVRGGGGGKGCYRAFNRGGYGSVVTGTQAVSAGDVLYIAVGSYGTDAYVGGAGVCSSSGSAASGAPGTNAFGSNGGATSDTHATAKGGGGGAASEIRLNGSATGNRLIVAAGGGGGGANMGTLDAERGGDASGNTGQSGYGNGSLGTSASGKGATTSAVGAAGSGAYAGIGVLGGNASGGGGSGGGGYFGGGGAYYDGGGAGSSWVTSATSVTYASAASYLTGSIVINYTAVPPQPTTVSLSVAGNPQLLTKGTVVDVTVTATNTLGKVTVFQNGKKIAGCISRSITASIVCKFKPTNRGIYSLTASFTPQSASYLPSTSSALSVGVGKRSTPR